MVPERSQHPQPGSGCFDHEETTMSRFLLLGCLFVCGFLSACSEETTDTETPACSSDDQCAKGMRCLNHQCISLSCEVREECLSGEICKDGQCQADDGSDEALCNLGVRRCTVDGSAVEVCAQGSYGLAWQAFETCANGCSFAACVKDDSDVDGDEEAEEEAEAEVVCEAGEQRCYWNNAETCRTDGSGWDVTETCMDQTQCQGTPPHCGAPQICGAGMRMCEDETTIRVCNEDGTAWEYTDCAAGGTCSDEDMQCHYPQTTCIQNRYQCFNNVVQKCVYQNGALRWVNMDDCSTDGTCVCLEHVNDTCTLADCQASPVCTPLQRRCNTAGTAVEMCQIYGLGWVTMETCEEGTSCVNNACQ